MLRDSNDRPASGLENPVNLFEDALIFGNVLNYVERADHVEVLARGDRPRIHLEESDVWAQSAPRVGQPLGVKFASCYLEIRVSPFQCQQNRTRAAANFEKGARSRKVLAQQRNDKVCPVDKPEARFLKTQELLEQGRVEAAVG